MRRDITIKKLKGIDEMRVSIPTKPGVYLLVGENGVGKTTLLVCMHRVCNSYAFADNFPKPSADNHIDQYKDAEIIYESDNGKVTYSKGSKRWNPTPYRAAEQCHSGFGFSGSIFAKVDNGRVGYKWDDIQNGPRKSPSPFLRNAIDEIFEDGRFDHLKLLENKNGRRWFQDYFVVEIGEGEVYSERRFSSGELAVLRLLSSLEKADPDSLILLDEVELALHPKVQRKLLKFLKRLAKEKNLVVIVATHSQTLIANENPKNILLLDNDAIKLKTPCYPSEAMKSIDLYSSVLSDFLVLVEDERAQKCFSKMCRMVVEDGAKGQEIICPILPVAGFEQTAKLAIIYQEEAPEHTSIRAVLDADAFTNNNPKFAKMTDQYKDVIHSLGFTPEVRLIELIYENIDLLSEHCTQRYRKNIKEFMSSDEYKSVGVSKANPNEGAKDQFASIVKYLMSGLDTEEVVAADLIETLIGYMDIVEIKKIVCPVFNK